MKLRPRPWVMCMTAFVMGCPAPRIATTDDGGMGVDVGAGGDAGVDNAGDAGTRCGMDPACPVGSGGYIDNAQCAIACPAGLICNLGGICETPRYTATDGGTVKDEVTGLIWQQGNGPRCTSAGCGDGYYTWDATGTDPLSAQYYCANLSLGGYTTGWRLPTITELFSLFDVGQAPSSEIDAAYFPAGVSSWYWSSTRDAAFPDYVWFVSFGNYGGVDSAVPVSAYDVRCVR